MTTMLVTGAAGFIGTNYVRRRLQHAAKDRVVVLDALTYAGNLENLKDLEENDRFRFVRGDISDPKVVDAVFAEEKPDVIVHFAAESHVDRSISGPAIFTSTNVLGTQTLLEAARKTNTQRFVMVSTDEVYGSLGPTGYFTETTPLSPNSPYSASKASADLLTLAYHRTYGFDAVVTRCSNNYGPFQFPEKLIPLMILNALEDKPLPVYGDGQQVRDWIHVFDHCTAIDRVLESGKAGEVYNIGSRNERPNLEIVKAILKHLKKPETLIRYVEDRPGHDRRYAIDSTRVETELGWKPEYTFEKGIAETIQWYLDSKDWWSRIRSGAYQSYYDEQYGQRLSN